MTKATKTIGTAQDSAKTSGGYVASGESSFSRRMAHPDHVRMPSYVKPPRTRSRQTHDNAANIRVQEIEIERMQRKTMNEHDQDKLAKLRKNIAIKQAFVERLKQEDAEGIETIPGEFDIEPWRNIR